MEGIIFKIADFKESSKILNILTPNGIESVIARGSKKINSPFISLCQTYNRINYERTDKEMYSLKEGFIIDDLEKIKVDYNKNLALSLMLRHLYLINDMDELFYSFILKAIEALKIYDEKSVYLMFKIKLLYFLGINIQFICKSCGEKNNLINFSIPDGACLCNKCTSINNSRLVELVYRSYYDKSFGVIFNEYDYKITYEFIKQYYFEHLNCNIKNEDKL